MDAYPHPHVEDSLNTLGGAQFFCSLDLTSGYWQVEMDTADREKTAFVTQGGLYEYRVMPFRLVNPPATFERLMERVLRGIAWLECLVYLDDILVFGPGATTKRPPPAFTWRSDRGSSRSSGTGILLAWDACRCD